MFAYIAIIPLSHFLVLGSTVLPSEAFVVVVHLYLSISTVETLNDV